MKIYTLYDNNIGFFEIYVHKQNQYHQKTTLSRHAVTELNLNPIINRPQSHL